MIKNTNFAMQMLYSSKENLKLRVSVKALLEDPYKNIRIYFTEGGEHIGKVTGYAPNRYILN